MREREQIDWNEPSQHPAPVQAPPLFLSKYAQRLRALCVCLCVCECVAPSIGQFRNYLEPRWTGPTSTDSFINYLNIEFYLLLLMIHFDQVNSIIDRKFYHFYRCPVQSPLPHRCFVIASGKKTPDCSVTAPVHWNCQWETHRRPRYYQRSTTTHSNKNKITKIVMININEKSRFKT